MSEQKSFIAVLLEDGGVTTEIPIDARMSSNYHFSATVTDLPVDDGATVANHRRINPDELTLDLVVSDVTPASVPSSGIGLKGDSTSNTSSNGSRQQDAFTILQRVHEKSLPLSVVTEYKAFDNMMLIDWSIAKDSSSGSAFRAQLQLKQVRVVSISSTTLPSDATKKLKKPGKTPTAEERTKLEQYKANLQLAVKSKKITQEEADRQMDNASRSIGLKVKKRRI